MLTWYCHQARVQTLPRIIWSWASTNRMNVTARMACIGIRLTTKAPAWRTAAKISKAQVTVAIT